MRFLLLMPLVVSLSVAPAAAIQIDYSSLAALEASGIGPRIAHHQQDTFFDGRYEDGSVAAGFILDLTGDYPDNWFSSVYFNGTFYSYAYGVSELVCKGGPCHTGYTFLGEAHLLGGELIGATLGDRWGAILEPSGGQGPTGFSPLAQTAEGFTFGPVGAEGALSWFYLQTERPPARMFGRLSGTSSMSDGTFEPGPLLVYTMDMDAFVPIPEPGTLVLVTTGLAGALMHRRRQKRRIT
jgi:hypothetical protein